MFFDPTHQIHNTVTGKCWQKKGGKYTLILSSNTGRKRLSVLGAINAVSTKFSSLITEDNCDKEMVKATLSEIRKDYFDNKKIVLILDNAAYNRAYETQDFARSLNIELKFLPPYCPNLNFIERLWKLMKKEILKNIYYPAFSDFYDAIINFCSNLQIYQNEINNILSQKFQIIKAV